MANKRHKANLALVPEKALGLGEAVAVLKKFKTAKFDESVEIAMELGIDPKKSDQMVRGAVSLPRGLGREKRVIVFCKEERVQDAQRAGAIEAGGDELAKKITSENWMDFDVAIATPDMMGVVGKLGKVLGPQGKMPSPKSGTVTPDIKGAVKEFRAGKVEFRADAGGNVHAAVGKASFAADAIQENVTAFVDHIRNLRPASVKGKFIEKVTLSTSMGPGIHVDIE